MASAAVRPLVRIAAIALASAPLLFGVLRAAQTRSDFRYLIVAVVSIATTANVILAGRRGGRTSAARAIVSFFVATLAAMGAAFLQGARSLPAIATVAAAFACCHTVAAVIGLEARPAQTPLTSDA